MRPNRRPYCTPAPAATERTHPADSAALSALFFAYLAATAHGRRTAKSDAIYETLADCFGRYKGGLRARPMPPRREATSRPLADVSIETLRPLLRDKGVLWGRDALERYKVTGFGKLSAEQRVAIYAELN